MSFFRVIICLTALSLLCCGCAPASVSEPASEESSVSAPALEPPQGDTPVLPPVGEQPTSETAKPVDPPPAPKEPEAVPTAQPTQEESPADVDPQPDDVPAFHIVVPERPAYDFSLPVPECAPVEDSYFADAAFLGDSRTEGFWLYSGVKAGKLLAGSGLSVFSLHEKTVASVGGTKYTAPEILSMESFGKVYIGLGLNELGYRDIDAVYTAYCNAVDMVRRHQPQAVIYLQTLIPVNSVQAAASGSEGHVNNDRIQLYNDLIRQIAAEKQVPVLDLYSAFIVDGQLPEDASRDGIHLLPPYCKKQLDYMKCHTVTPEQLTASAPPEEAPDLSDAPAQPPAETEVSEI